MAKLGQLTRNIFCAINGDLIRLRNRSKLVKGSLFAIIDSERNLSLCTLLGIEGGGGGGVRFFKKKSQILKKKLVHSIFLHLVFFCVITAQ